MEKKICVDSGVTSVDLPSALFGCNKLVIQASHGLTNLMTDSAVSLPTFESLFSKRVTIKAEMGQNRRLKWVKTKADMGQNRRLKWVKIKAQMDENQSSNGSKYRTQMGENKS